MPERRKRGNEPEDHVQRIQQSWFSRRKFAVLVVAGLAIIYVANLIDAFGRITGLVSAVFSREPASANAGPPSTSDAPGAALECTFVVVTPLSRVNAQASEISLTLERDLAPVHSPITRRTRDLDKHTLLAIKGLSNGTYAVHLVFDRRPAEGNYADIRGNVRVTSIQQVYYGKEANIITGNLTIDPVGSMFVPRLVDNSSVQLPNCAQVTNGVSWR